MSRPLGFIENWKPRSATVDLLEKVGGIIREYSAFGPMTCRQIFYRLVASHDYRKTDRNYLNLCEILQRARRARIIDFENIRDDGNVKVEGGGASSVHATISAIDSYVRFFSLDPSYGQPFRIIVLCESAGMVPMLANIVRPFGASVQSAGGFDSVTGKYQLASSIAGTARARANSRPTVILHIGDYDPSGEHIYSALRNDILAFLGPMIAPAEPESAALFHRIAVTPEQIRRLGLPTAPAKASDNRAFAGIDGDPRATVQAEAFDPAQLAEIVTSAIARFWNEESSQALKAREAREREQLEQWWAGCPFFEGS